ncbi:MAG TPA: Asp23/Gls24 family envelope stress response protein [Thermoanaerobacterales bacterium]|nr:Asp23/Gls24 family envelope stress response protein [Thermoanaerobacterales bacterium]
MQVVALIGKSGTGKSHKALSVAGQNDIEMIIDDGLLIYGNRVVAGTSAKREDTKFAAVRRAVFFDPEHANEVQKKIREINPDAILILGTSKKMVKRICDALSLPEPSKIIRIEDISTPQEIKNANKSRYIEGKHIIPVPTPEIKRHFSGYLLDSLKIFYKKGKRSKVVAEKSVVRPTYSYLGKYTISDTVINQIALYVAHQVDGVAQGGRVFIENYDDGIVLNVDLVVEYGLNIREILLHVQKKVAESVEYMTAINVLKTNVTAQKINVM